MLNESSSRRARAGGMGSLGRAGCPPSRAAHLVLAGMRHSVGRQISLLLPRTVAPTQPLSAPLVPTRVAGDSRLCLLGGEMLEPWGGSHKVGSHKEVLTVVWISKKAEVDLRV